MPNYEGCPETIFKQRGWQGTENGIRREPFEDFTIELVFLDHIEFQLIAHAAHLPRLDGPIHRFESWIKSIDDAWDFFATLPPSKLGSM